MVNASPNRTNLVRLCLQITKKKEKNFLMPILTHIPIFSVNHFFIVAYFFCIFFTFMYSYTFQFFLPHVQHFSHIAPLFLGNVTSLLLLCDSKRILSSLGIHNTKLLPLPICCWVSHARGDTPSSIQKKWIHYHLNTYIYEYQDLLFIKLKYVLRDRLTMRPRFMLNLAILLPQFPDCTILPEFFIKDFSGGIHRV